MAIAAIAKIALGAGKASGALGKVSVGAGGVAKGVVVAEAILKSVKGLWGTMRDISGQLKSTMNIFGKTMKLLLKPIGDVVGMLLRPLALGLLRFAIPVYKKFYQSDFFKALMKPPEDRTEGEKAKVLTAKIGTGAVAGAAIGGGVAGLPGAAIGGMIGGIVGAIKSAIQGVKNLIYIGQEWAEFLIRKWKELRDKMVEIIGNIAEKIVIFFTEDIPAAWENIKLFFTKTVPDWITETWEKVRIFFTKTVPEWLTDTWGDVKNFLSVTVPNWFKDGWGALKSFIMETVPGWFKSGFDKIKDKISSFVDKVMSKVKDVINKLKDFKVSDLWKKDEEEKAIGGYVSQTGMQKLHAGEYVLRSGQIDQLLNNRSGGMSFNPTINIQATVSNDYDVKRLAQRLSEYYEIEMRRKVSY